MPTIQTTLKIPSATPGWALDVWKYVPSDTGGSHPVIVMAHGLSGNKLISLAEYAEVFVTLGFACIVFDYRRWGTSDGTPRNIIVVSEQLEDYRTVIKYARQQPEFDPQRVIVWGTSFSGGHAIKLASEPALNLRAAIAQCPYTGVVAKVDITVGYIKTLLLAVYDRIKQVFGFSPFYVPVSTKPDGTGLLVAEDGGLEAWAENWPDSGWINQISASSAFEIAAYKPAARELDITCPLLIVAPEEDTICPIPGAIAVSKGVESCTLVTLSSAGHFDVYPKGSHYDHSIGEQVEFLKDNMAA